MKGEIWNTWELLVAITVVAVLSLLGTATLACNVWEREAVNHNAASYYLDKNNERQWSWNDDLQKEQSK